MARPGEELVTTLIRLHEALKVTTLPLALSGADQARVSCRETVSQLEDYVLPRALQVEAPLIAVVGSTRKIRLASRTANLPAAVALWGLVVAWLPVDVWFLSALDVFQVLFPGYARAG